MPRIRRAEREAVITALTVEHESVDDAADAAIIALDAVREKDMAKTVNRPWCVLMQAKKGVFTETFGSLEAKLKGQPAMKCLCSRLKIHDHPTEVLKPHKVRH